MGNTEKQPSQIVHNLEMSQAARAAYESKLAEKDRIIAALVSYMTGEIEADPPYHPGDNDYYSREDVEAIIHAAKDAK